jgi:alpha-L-fucosidase
MFTITEILNTTKLAQIATAILGLSVSALCGAETVTPSAKSFEEPVATGPFQPNWDSLAQYQCPGWFRDAKFGIWAVWSAQCVPEKGDWYAHWMYVSSDPDNGGKPHGHYSYHLEHYGHPSKFGFKDLIHAWRAEKWEPDKLMALYKKAGAKYFATMANHHDNFDNYDSKYQPWNSVKVGPKKDIVGIWEKAARAAGLRFGVTVHPHNTWTWMDAAHGADKEGPLAGVPYDGNLTRADGKGQWWEGLDPADLYGPAGAARTPEALAAFNLKYFNRTMDLVNKYRPDLLYFDIGPLPMYGEPGDYGFKIASHYYNSSIAWHGKNEGVMNTKYLDAQQQKCLVHDIERGKRETIAPNPWQTDTCIGTWHFDRETSINHWYKKPADVVPMLVDIVSKNGNLLLSIPIRADGTIDEDEQAFLEEMGKWTAVNGEGIFSTRPWKIFGEGPATTADSGKGVAEGQADVGKIPFTAQDIRFTASKDGKTLFAIALGWPTDGKLVVKSLAKNALNYPGEINSVELLGSREKIAFTRDATGLTVTLPTHKPCDYAYVFKVQ